jgi:hypothetical protein
MTIAAESNNTPEKGLSLDEAYAQLKASQKKAQESPEELDDENVEVVEEEELDLEEEEEDFESEEEDEDAEESEDDDLEDDEEESEDSEEEGEEPEVWELEIDGETVEVTTEELHKGYLRHNDYTRKRQADAKKAKELEADYQGRLDELNTALANNVSQDEVTLNELTQKYQATTDDTEKRNLHYQILQIQSNVQTRKAALEQTAALQRQTQEAEAEAYWAEQEEILSSKYEDWDTKKVELKTYLEDQGFEDLRMFAHANMAEIVDKAKQFDELQQKRETVVKKKIKRKVPKVLKAGQGEKKFNIDQKKIKDLEARFAKSGSIKDAQALMRARRGK